MTCTICTRITEANLIYISLFLVFRVVSQFSEKIELRKSPQRLVASVQAITLNRGEGGREGSNFLNEIQNDVLTTCKAIIEAIASGFVKC